MFSPLTLLVFIIAFSIFALVYNAITDFNHKRKEKTAKASGYKSAILYELKNGKKILVSAPQWVEDDAKETADYMRKDAQNVSSILNHREFKKITGEEFEPDRMTVEKIKAGSEKVYTRYSNNKLKEPATNN